MFKFSLLLLPFRIEEARVISGFAMLGAGSRRKRAWGQRSQGLGLGAMIGHQVLTPFT